MGATGLSVTVLGCDGSYPGPGGACSGYLLRHEGAVWLDAGSGTLANLQTHMGIDQLDAVVVTHQHPDHWTDLEHLAVACKWDLGIEGIPVYAPAGLRELMRVGAAAEVLDWRPLDESTQMELGGMAFAFSRTDHPVPTYAVRVDAGGRAIGYSADSGPAWPLGSLGQGLDLVLCEATFLSDKEGTVKHLSARQAGEAAARAGAKRLVITHLLPRVDPEAALAEAVAAFGGEVELARVGERYEP